MSLWELFILAIGLSMDAFAVAICKGLSVGKTKWQHCILCGLYFGGFQALMPFIGYLLGKQFSSLITGIDHWLAFLLLAIIGAITFLFGMAGVKIGSIFGIKFKSKAELAGGIILIGMGLKILLEHTEFFKHF